MSKNQFPYEVITVTFKVRDFSTSAFISFVSIYPQNEYCLYHQYHTITTRRTLEIIRYNVRRNFGTSVRSFIRRLFSYSRIRDGAGRNPYSLGKRAAGGVFLHRIPALQPGTVGTPDFSRGRNELTQFPPVRRCSNASNKTQKRLHFLWCLGLVEVCLFLSFLPVRQLAFCIIVSRVSCRSLLVLVVC